MAQYERHSPSKLNLFAASPAMFVLEHVLGEEQPVGAAAPRGSAVEEGVAMGLMFPDAPLADCVTAALKMYDTRTTFSGDPRRERYRKAIPDMVKRALEELRKYGIPSVLQNFHELKVDDLALPIVGYSDFEWDYHGIILDLKTTEKCPSSIKVPHARQVAFYAKSDNADARLLYCTPAKVEPYRLENIREHRAALIMIARKVEKFLALSDDPMFFVDITVPDLESFYWMNPVARALAFKYWKI